MQGSSKRRLGLVDRNSVTGRHKPVTATRTPATRARHRSVRAGSIPGLGMKAGRRQRLPASLEGAHLADIVVQSGGRLVRKTWLLVMHM